jgi:hypothetical protein
MSTQHPGELVTISPESTLIANQYLQCGNMRETAELLELELTTVANTLDRPDVRAYCNAMWMERGYNSRDRIRDAMDAVIEQKLLELTESGTGSTKDIADLLLISHKISMEHLDRQLALEKLRQPVGLKNQVNVQINETGDGSRYAQLITRLLEPTRADDIQE